MQEVANRQLKESRKKIFSRFERNRDILIVDDEESIGVGMSETLKDAGYNVRYVTSGAEAIEAVQNTAAGYLEAIGALRITKAPGGLTVE